MAMSTINIVLCTNCLQEYYPDHGYACPGPFRGYQHDSVRVTLDIPEEVLRAAVIERLRAINEPGLPTENPRSEDKCGYCGKIRAGHDENGSKYSDLNGEYFRCKAFIERCPVATNGGHLFQRYEREPEADECIYCGKSRFDIGGLKPEDRPLADGNPMAYLR